MNLPPYFTQQEFANDGAPLAGGKLYTYVSGTTTPQVTYEDQAGTVTNANPIILDSAGRFDLWLDPALEYTFRLTDANDVLIYTKDDIGGSAVGTGIVTSVNTETGAVVLTADDIGFTTTTSTTWFVGTDVSAALDDIIAEVDGLLGESVALTAAGIPIVDSGGLITGTNVETALAELAAKVAVLPVFTAVVDAGNLTVSVANGSDVSLGSRSVSVTGGTSPFRYNWFGSGATSGASSIYVTGGNTATAAFFGSGTDVLLNAYFTCIITDATGRVTTAAVTVAATHGSP